MENSVLLVRIYLPEIPRVPTTRPSREKKSISSRTCIIHSHSFSPSLFLSFSLSISFFLTLFLLSSFPLSLSLSLLFLSRAHAARLRSTSHKERQNSVKHFSWRRSRLEQGSMARRRLTFDGRCTARFCSLFPSFFHSFFLSLALSPALARSLSRSSLSVYCLLRFLLFLYFYFIFSRSPVRSMFFSVALTRRNVRDGSDARTL